MPVVWSRQFSFERKQHARKPTPNTAQHLGGQSQASSISCRFHMIAVARLELRSCPKH